MSKRRAPLTNAALDAIASALALLETNADPENDAPGVTDKGLEQALAWVYAERQRRANLQKLVANIWGETTP